MRMKDLYAFLDAVIENPDDDTPRLVFADWLEEQGRGPRAEFIRVQCELARLTEESPRRKKLARREKALLKEWGERWAAPLWQLASEWVYRRGFIEQVVIGPVCGTAPHLLKGLFELAPVRHVCFNAFINLPDLAAATEHLRPLLTLEMFELQIKNNADRKALRAVLTSPHLANLTALRVMGDGMENGRIDGKTVRDGRDLAAPDESA
jgi:uncharacterized protein (TIGR02996 family)